jgi:hypothetical protein
MMAPRWRCPLFVSSLSCLGVEYKIFKIRLHSLDASLLLLYDSLLLLVCNEDLKYASWFVTLKPPMGVISCVCLALSLSIYYQHQWLNFTSEQGKGCRHSHSRCLNYLGKPRERSTFAIISSTMSLSLPLRFLRGKTFSNDSAKKKTVFECAVHELLESRWALLKLLCLFIRPKLVAGSLKIVNSNYKQDSQIIVIERIIRGLE